MKLPSSRQLAFVVRNVSADGLAESFSQQVDAPPGSDLRLADLFAAGWTVVATEAMPGGFEAACLIVVEAPPDSGPVAAVDAARRAAAPDAIDGDNLEWHAPNLAAWDGETISLARLGIG